MTEEKPTGPFDVPWGQLTSEQIEAIEGFSRAMSEAMASAHSALGASAMKSYAKGPDAIDPDPFKIAPDMTKVMAGLANDPGRAAEAQMRLWQGYMELWGSAAQHFAQGGDAKDAVAPQKGDKRWRSEEWSENPVFDIIKQSYLLTSNWLVETLQNVDGVDESAKRQVAFFTKQLADAFAPTNFALTNPDVLKQLVETRGANVARGLRNLAADIERGGGRLSISQTDLDKFEVGRDVAATPGSVIYQNDLIQLIQYTPTTETQHETPILFFPPWINKFYILDLRPDNSMVKWLLDRGHSVFLVSWVNPDASHKDKTFEDYMDEGVYAALEATLEQSGAEKVNTVGYCIGGALLASTLAYMKRQGDERIASATFFAAQMDFELAGDLLMFTSDDWLAEIERRMDANGGVLDGQTMADVFNMLRANDLIWSFVINNYLLGNDPRPFDLLFWNADQTRLPKTIHLYYLRQFYRNNALANGQLTIKGEKLDLGEVELPVYMQASREDHIAPFASVYRGAKLFGGPLRFVLAGSGHIAGVINPPIAEKYQHWLRDDDALPETTEDWLSGAEEHPGSWWEDWDAWLGQHSGEDVDARDPENGPLKPIEPAPGSYVKVRS